MVLMVIDHVRVFAAVPSQSAEPTVFLTRWITHFCAPTFLFLAGTSAFLSQRKRTKDDQAKRLLWRGLGLVALELIVIRVAWTFDLRFNEYLLAGVIWAIGWSMVLLSCAIRLPWPWLLGLALLVIGGHDLLASLLELGNPWQEDYAWPWRILYLGGLIEIGSGPTLVVLYSVLPWFAIMLAGFVFGRVLNFAPAQRARVCIAIGASCIVAFVLLRATNAYGDPRAWTATDRPGWIAFLDLSKYPPSFLYVLMTLGPVIGLFPLIERAHEVVPSWLTRFGRVPLLFYVLHIPVIHAVALLVSVIRTPEATPWLFGTFPVPLERAPPGYRYPLSLLYGTALATLVLLHFACRRLAGRKGSFRTTSSA